MMQEVKFSGQTAVPGDYSCRDGELSMSLNLINEDGALRPIAEPYVRMKLPDLHRVLWIHRVDQTRTHYIVLRGNGEAACSLCWLDVQSAGHEPDADSFKEMDGMKRLDYDVWCRASERFAAIGNTMMVNTPDEGIVYYLWTKGAYKRLGTEIPELPLSFGLRLGLSHPFDAVEVRPPVDGVDSIFVRTYGDGIPSGEHREHKLSDEAIRILTDAALGCANRWAEEVTRQGAFAMPFFVRYGLRLYDGTLVRHSSPCLMRLASASAPNPVVFIGDWDYYNGEPFFEYMWLDTFGVCGRLDYAIDEAVALDELKENWGDIVESVEIYVSPPLWTYDQGGKCKIPADILAADARVRLGFFGSLHTDGSSEYRWRTYKEVYDTGIVGEYTLEHRSRQSHVPLPEFSKQKIDETVENTSEFYLLKEIRLSELPTDGKRHVIDIGEDYLDTLTARKQMDDESASLGHDRITARSMFTYNDRLCLSGIGRVVSNRMSPGAMIQYSSSNGGDGGESPYELWFAIDESGNEIDVCLDSRWLWRRENGWGCHWIYYPNVNAKRLYIRRYDADHHGDGKWKCIELKEHPKLNGVYAMDMENDLFYEPSDSGTWPGLVASADETERTVDLSNRVYVSEAGNPLVFPAGNAVAVGNGTVMGLSSAAKALSQGQFGQFPLYAFTTEGVWALEVSDTGTFSARQPITRDVCTNPKGITQIDRAVIFPTSAGLMMIEGADVRCISESVDAKGAFNPVTILPRFKDILDITSGIAPELTAQLRLSDYLTEGSVLYDYAHSRLIVYSTAQGAPKAAYVLSLASGMWGMMTTDVDHGINSYPDCLAMSGTKPQLLDFGDLSADGVGKPMPDGIMLTRPMKLGGADVLKTVRTAVIRGDFAKGCVATALYGSRDMRSWHLVWTSRDHWLRGFSGSPYKYFRVLAITSVKGGDTLDGITMDVEAKELNRLR